MTDIVEKLLKRAQMARAEETVTSDVDALHFEEAAAEIARLRAASEWRDISTAPRGRDDMIDVWCVSPDEDEPGSTRLTDVFWYIADEILPHTGWARITDDGDIDFVELEARGLCGLPPWKPTHWQPLPAPPQRNEVKK